MTRLSLVLLVVLAWPVLAADVNPFFQEWKTPFGVPPFDQIKDQHFLPAIQKGIEEQRREIKAIADDPRAPTFANTIEALDNSGDLLEKVQNVFGNLTGAETNDRLQEISRQVAPLMAALRDDTILDPRLFARVKAIWDQRGKLKLEADQSRLLEET